MKACRKRSDIDIVGISVLLDRVSKQDVTVGVDGSLYRYHPKFHNLITEKVAALSPSKKVSVARNLSTNITAILVGTVTRTQFISFNQ